MPTFDPMTLVLCGIVAIALVAAAAAFEAGRVYADRKVRALRLSLTAEQGRYEHLAYEFGRLTARVDAYAADCDADSDDLADLAKRVRKLEATTRPAPRQRFALSVPDVLRESHAGLRALHALPPAPSVREAIDPPWNGGTATYDALTAKLGLAATDTGTWLAKGPDVGRVALPMPLSAEETGQIPRITVEGELVEAS